MQRTSKDIFSRQDRIYQRLRPYLVQFFLCLLITGIHLSFLFTGKLVRFEHLFLDYFFRNRPAPPIDSSIVLIEIGEESLQAIGRWPWPWHYHAQMVDLLREWEAKAIVFNLIFKHEQASFENTALELTLEKTKNVYFPVLLEEKPKKKYWIHALPLTVGAEQDEKVWTHSAHKLEQHATAVGHINAESDSDGVLRRIAPFLGKKEIHPYLGLKVAYEMQGNKLRRPEDFGAPLDEKGNLILNWAGPAENFNRVSYAELIRSLQALKTGRLPIVDPTTIKEKICLIGLTSEDAANFKVTPVDSAYPSLGVLATAMNTILTANYITPLTRGMQGVLLAFIGLISAYYFTKLRNVTAFALGLLFGFLWIFFAYLLFRFSGIWVYVFQPLLMILSLFIFSTLYTHLMELRERNRLFHLATRDGLTGLLIIRYFREILNQAVKEASSSGEPVTVLLIDIDNFKSINDTFGHLAGDQVLRTTAKIIQSSLRSKKGVPFSDVAARYGGEEFILMLRQTKLEEAVAEVGEKIRRDVAAEHFVWEGKKIPVTVSIGAGRLHKGENIPDPTVRRADEALYQAKRTGKNKVCVEEEKNHRTES